MVKEISTIVLNEDQAKAEIAILEWLVRTKNNKDNSNFFALTGAAGTGKTTLLGSVLNKLPSNYYRSRVCISAPTHKAKKVLQSKTDWRQSETIQALLGLKVDVSLDDFDINNPVFNPINERKIRDYSLVIIDESSMINQELYTTIVDCAKQYATKILFVGDIKQLNPVKEYSISLALTMPINKYELTTIVRQQNGNPLLELFDILREDIDANTDNYIKYLTANPVMINDKGEGYSVLNRADFSVELSKAFQSDAFKEDRNYCRYITWTNVNITSVNKWIRENVFKSPAPLVQGELLLSYKTIINDDAVLITNSDDYEVTAIEHGVNEYGIEVLLVGLEGIDTGNCSTVQIVLPTQENYALFLQHHFDKLTKAKIKKGRAWVDYFKFKEQHCLLESLFNDENKKQLIVKKDIDYGYGISIHKSQGSTYDTVFVNGADINRNFREEEKRRLWYVALSRTSNRVYINL